MLQCQEDLRSFLEELLNSSKRTSQWMASMPQTHIASTNLVHTPKTVIMIWLIDSNQFKDFIYCMSTWILGEIYIWCSRQPEYFYLFEEIQPNQIRYVGLNISFKVNNNFYVSRDDVLVKSRNLTSQICCLWPLDENYINWTFLVLKAFSRLAEWTTVFVMILIHNSHISLASYVAI